MRVAKVWIIAVIGVILLVIITAILFTLMSDRKQSFKPPIGRFKSDLFPVKDLPELKQQVSLSVVGNSLRPLILQQPSVAYLVNHSALLIQKHFHVKFVYLDSYNVYDLIKNPVMQQSNQSFYVVLFFLTDTLIDFVDTGSVYFAANSYLGLSIGEENEFKCLRGGHVLSLSYRMTVDRVLPSVFQTMRRKHLSYWKNMSDKKRTKRMIYQL
jgi:ABC-type antimicrobial peptide transport system permease subunit